MVRSRVAIGHLRGHVAVLDCQLPSQSSPTVSPESNLGTASAAQSTTLDSSTTAAATLDSSAPEGRGADGVDAMA
jgi:hypothetical protein